MGTRRFHSRAWAFAESVYKKRNRINRCVWGGDSLAEGREQWNEAGSKEKRPGSKLRCQPGEERRAFELVLLAKDEV